LTRTFTGVFPNVLVFLPAGAGEILLIASPQAIQLDPLVMQERMNEPGISADLKRAGIRSAKAVIEMLIADRDQLRAFDAGMRAKNANSSLNTDDNLLTEYRLGPQIYGAAATIDANLKALTGSQ
jgi:hypothetical protein